MLNICSTITIQFISQLYRGHAARNKPGIMFLDQFGQRTANNRKQCQCLNDSLSFGIRGYHSSVLINVCEHQSEFQRNSQTGYDRIDNVRNDIWLLFKQLSSVKANVSYEHGPIKYNLSIRKYRFFTNFLTFRSYLLELAVRNVKNYNFIPDGNTRVVGEARVRFQRTFVVKVFSELFNLQLAITVERALRYIRYRPRSSPPLFPTNNAISHTRDVLYISENDKYRAKQKEGIIISQSGRISSNFIYPRIREAKLSRVARNVA